MESIAVIILAAGKGTRMGQDMPKVLTQTDENPLLFHVIDYSQALVPEKTVVVTGYQSDRVREAVLTGDYPVDTGSIEFALQEQQNGTGDAVRAALPYLKGFSGTVVILYGDVPLLQKSTLIDLVSMHHESDATLTLISLKGDVANAYGRIIRDPNGHIVKITELKDCSIAEKFIDETNAGIYAVDSAFLEPAIDSLSNDNAQKEYYLTDIVEKASSEGQTVCSISLFDASEMQGVNTRADLQLVNVALRKRRVVSLLHAGVEIVDPDSVFFDATVTVEAGAKIGPNVILRGKTHISAGAELEGSACLIDTHVGSDALIRFGVRCESAHIGKGASVGPFAHLRPKSSLGENVRIGNFVETKNAQLHAGVKAGHLSYLGDCEIHSEVNIGAGTIFANYDGKNKHKTTIHENSFIGSNSVLIAPIEIGSDVTVGAGSVLSKNVDSETLAFTRPPLKQKNGWKKKDT